MTIVIDHGNGADEGTALAGLTQDRFDAVAKDYAPGRTEPHQPEPQLLRSVPCRR